MVKIAIPEFSYNIIAPELENLTEEDFFNFCLQNKDIQIERDKNGQMLLMPPDGLLTSSLKATTGVFLSVWNNNTQSGKVFDSSAGFTLPDGSMRSPDAAWMSNEKYHALSQEEKQRFAHVVPDFVVELASPSDNLKMAKEKMEMWRRNGVRLSWLIIPQQEKVIIYRLDGSTVEIDGFAGNTLSGEDVLPGFELKLDALAGA
jgi:Uma2 family endonuclease